MNRTNLKMDARKRMEGNWKHWIYILLICLGIGLVVGLACIPIASNLSEDLKDMPQSICTGVLECLFGFGLVSFFLKIAKGEEVNYNELFSKTRMFLKYFLMDLIVSIIVIIGCILLIVPGFIFALGLSQVPYILVENPEMSIFDAIEKSWKMMKGHKWEYLVLNLSFIGWAIICAIPCGLGFIWLIPYYSTTISLYYLELKKEKKA